jgi:hypothetical protein
VLQILRMLICPNEIKVLSAQHLYVRSTPFVRNLRYSSDDYLG